MAPQTPLKHTSTLPSYCVDPSVSLISPVLQSSLRTSGTISEKKVKSALNGYNNCLFKFVLFLNKLFKHLMAYIDILLMHHHKFHKSNHSVHYEDSPK